MPVREGEPDPEPPAGGQGAVELQARHAVGAAEADPEDQGEAGEEQNRQDGPLPRHHHGHLHGHR